MSNPAVSETKPGPSKVGFNQILWLALTLTPGLGPTRSRRLVEFLGGVEEVFKATLSELEAAGLPVAAAQALATGRSIELAQDELAKAAAAGIRTVSLDDPEYPPELRQIYDPPLVLYVRGNAAVLSHPGIAMVGTRHPTPYGMGIAERLACDLAARNLVIFSGLARGVDTFAHRGAVSAKGKTVASLWDGRGRHVPQGKFEISRPDSQSRRGPDIRVPPWNICCSSEFSNSEPHYQRDFPRCTCSGGRRVQWHPHHRALRLGAESGSLRGSRKCDQQELLGTKHAD